MQDRCTAAFRVYRRAMHLARWAYLNELGAFQIQEAANGFREASQLLQSVSVALLRELPRYSHLFVEKKKKKKRNVRSARLGARQSPAVQKRAA